MFGSRSVLPKAAFRTDLVKRKVDQVKKTHTKGKVPASRAALLDAIAQERSQ